MVLLKFIGKNGSIGLVYGKQYKVSVASNGGYIWVKWYDKLLLQTVSCPYSSPQSFAANWGK